MNLRGAKLIFSVVLIAVGGNVYGLSGTQVFDKVSKSVVEVGTLKKKDVSKLKNNLVSYGSAVAVSHNIVATNCHVALTGKHIIIVKGNVYSYASVMAANKSQDICLLKVNKMTLVPVKLRASRDLSPVEDVYAIGNPHGIENHVSRGVISKVVRDKGNTWVLSDVAISSGSSGGGLFDAEGNLIGITTSTYKVSPNLSHSASVDWIIQKLNINPVYKEKNKLKPRIKKTLPNKKIPSSRYGIQLVGSYGDSNVKLYKYSGGCFIYFPGRRVSGLVTSAAVWFPGNRKLILVYPSARNVNKAIEIHYKNLDKNSKYSKQFKKTKHKLSLDKKYYDFYTSGKHRFTEKILLAAFPEDPTMIFAEGSKFVVYIADQKIEGGYRIRVFGLWGFSEALVNYNAKCLNKN